MKQCRQSKFVQLEQAVSGSAVCSGSENKQEISQTRLSFFFFFLLFIFIEAVSYGPEL